MAIKYLGKLRPIDFQDKTSYVQMVNVPELQEHSRCAFCHYFKEGRTSREFFDCSEKRKCGMESLLFLPMVNISKRDPNIINDFTLTPVTKQITIGNDKRYLQLLSSDVQGYECNQLCQYYPARIASEQSIAECANSHACGRNGSFWDLLTPRYPYLATYPNLKSDIIDETTMVCLDGTVLRNVELDTIAADASGLVKAKLTNGSSYNIVNMYWDSPMCGQRLFARIANNPKLWVWSFNSAQLLEADKAVIITDDNQPLYRKLIEIGYPEDNFLYPLKDLTRVRVSTSSRPWFVNKESSFDVVQSDGYQVIILKDYLYGLEYVVRFGTTGTNYLAARFPDETPNQWVKANVPNFNSSIYPVVTLTSYDDEMAQWLMTIGVRQSLFFFK